MYAALGDRHNHGTPQTVRTPCMTANPTRHGRVTSFRGHAVRRFSITLTSKLPVFQLPKSFGRTLSRHGHRFRVSGLGTSEVQSMEHTRPHSTEGYFREDNCNKVNLGRKNPKPQTLITVIHLGGCQNYGPFWGTRNTRCRIILRTPKRDHNFDNHPFGYR